RRRRPPKRRSRSGSSMPRFYGALLERRETLAPGLRSFGLRVGLDQFVDRAARRLGVLQLDLAVGDGQQRLGCLRAVGVAADERAERGHGFLVVALAVGRVAEPEQHRLVIPAARVALAERRERARSRTELAL